MSSYMFFYYMAGGRDVAQARGAQLRGAGSLTTAFGQLTNWYTEADTTPEQQLSCFQKVIRLPVYLCPKNMLPSNTLIDPDVRAHSSSHAPRSSPQPIYHMSTKIWTANS